MESHIVHLHKGVIRHLQWNTLKHYPCTLSGCKAAPLHVHLLLTSVPCIIGASAKTFSAIHLYLTLVPSSHLTTLSLSSGANAGSFVCSKIKGC